MNSSIWPIDWILTGTITPNKSGPRSYGNKEVLHILLTPRLGLTIIYSLVPYSRHSLEVLPFWRGVVGVFYSPNDNATNLIRWYNNPQSNCNALQYIFCYLYFFSKSFFHEASNRTKCRNKYININLICLTSFLFEYTHIHKHTHTHTLTCIYSMVRAKFLNSFK